MLRQLLIVLTVMVAIAYNTDASPLHKNKVKKKSRKELRKHKKQSEMRARYCSPNFDYVFQK